MCSAMGVGSPVGISSDWAGANDNMLGVNWGLVGMGTVIEGSRFRVGIREGFGMSTIIFPTKLCRRVGLGRVIDGC
jgi:hypothetical protein